jgi:HTH-type transcriptional regulator, sugar sensing transcriptional regulator
MFKEQLQQFGLTKTQSNVLDYLLESGESKARDIAKNIKQPRGVVYKSLDELLEMDLVEKRDKEKQVSLFVACHPRNLEKLLEKKEKEINQDKKIFEEVLPSLISNYNLTLNKPGVKFYEGEEGMVKILDDTLTSKTEILLFINTSSMEEEKKFQAINEDYKRKRKSKGVKKRIIRVGKKPEMTFGTRDDKYEAITQIRYLEKDLPSFKSNIQIYDGKISHQIIDRGQTISILMEDKNIYEMNKAWFDILWEISK